MKSLTSYLIIVFIIFFWILRVVVALTATMNFDFFIKPIDVTAEIVILFVSLAAIILIIKRNIIGAIIYFACNLLYFGATVITQVIGLTTGILPNSEYIGMAVSILGILLGMFALLDVLFNKDRTNTRVDNKTSWFYNNKDFDRQMDERADKNNYRTM